jgi:hypothetical protein
MVALEIATRGTWIPARARLALALPADDAVGTLVLRRHGLTLDQLDELLRRISRSWLLESRLALVHIHGEDGSRDDYGVVSRRVVTTAGVNYLAADFGGGASDVNLFKFHGIGTGAVAEAIGDTALGTELTTEYNPNSTRATGSQANSTNTYTTVGTNTLDSGTPAVTEHGVFTQAATGGGTLWDRSVFSAVNLTGANGDGLQSTYVLTCTAGG